MEIQTKLMDKKSSSLNIALAYQGFLDEPVPSALLMQWFRIK